MSASTTAGPGRPRDPRIDEAVLAATRELLVEVGYAALTYERVARRAGATRPAIYRRWPSKAHLVHDAVFPEPGDDPVPDTGSFADDLRTMIRRSLRSYARPEARIAVPGLLADLDDPERRRTVVDGLQDQVRAQLADRVARAEAGGDLRPGVDADLVLDTFIGALTHRVVARQSADPRFADDLTDLLLRGLQREPLPAPPLELEEGRAADEGARRVPDRQ